MNEKRLRNTVLNTHPIQNTSGARRIDPKERHETDFWNRHSGSVCLENWKSKKNDCQ